MELFAFQLLNGIVWGLLLALIALGLSLIYGLMRINNLAHGSLFMLGAMLAAYGANRLNLDFWLAAVLSSLALGAFMLLLNTALFTRIMDRDITVGLLATAGLLLTIDNTALGVFGGEPQSVDAPIEDAVSVAGIDYPAYRLAAAAIAVLVLLAVWAFMRFTKYGLWMRAVPMARELAPATGIPILRVNAITLALGGLTAGLAGALATPITGAHFQMGLAILAPSFIVVVIGGLGQSGRHRRRGDPVWHRARAVLRGDAADLGGGGDAAGAAAHPDDPAQRPVRRRTVTARAIIAVLRVACVVAVLGAPWGAQPVLDAAGVYRACCRPIWLSVSTSPTATPGCSASARACSSPSRPISPSTSPVPPVGACRRCWPAALRRGRRRGCLSG